MPALTLIMSLMIAVVPPDSAGTADSLYARNRLLLHPVRYDPAATTLSLTVHRDQSRAGALGYRLYRVSQARCVLEGAGMGASLGFMAGALGEMSGVWGENTSWALGGAMAAFGALYGGMRSEDRDWTLRIGWDEPARPPKLE